MPVSEAAGTARLPLAGVRVLDLSDEAGVLAPRLLADLGADVIRVEPLTGDLIRRRGPFLDGEAGLDRSLAHLLYNTGKRSLALALDTSEAWELLDRMLAAVDVVVAPLEKSQPARAFFDERRLRLIHKRLSVVDVILRAVPHDPMDAAAGTGIIDGHEAVPAPIPAVIDMIGVAAGGLLYLNGFAEDPPNVPTGKLAYKQTSLAAALAAMSLIMAARRTRRGGWITVNMQEAVTWTTLQTANENYWHWHHRRPGRTGKAGLGKAGSKSIFRCKDGLWISVAIHPPHWDRFARWSAEVTGCRDLLGEEWLDPFYRYEQGARIAELIDAIASRLTRDAMLRQGQSHGVLIGPVNGPADIAHDEQLRARGIFREIYHPQFERELTMVRPPFFSSAYEVPARPAPTLGQHSAQVLKELLSLDDAGIGRLVSAGIVHVPS
ncbi:MAG: CoA transferase [Dehalococcoidia bacterium]